MTEKEIFGKYPEEVKEFLEIQDRMQKKMMQAYLDEENKYTALLGLMNMPLNLVMSVLSNAEELPKDLLPDVPGAFIRMLKPMEKVQHHWGSIPVRDFCKLYRIEYDKNQKEHFGIE